MEFKKQLYFDVGTKLIRQALREQKLLNTYRWAERIVPDISDQYTYSKVNTDYLRTKVRGLHAFQISLFEWLWKNKAKGFGWYKEGIRIIDFGDSSGNHSLYLKAANVLIRNLVSFSIDEIAIRRIKEKGLKTFTDTIVKTADPVDVCLLFEVLEHIKGPVMFLEDLSNFGKCIVLTVPYLRRSRVGLHYLRRGKGNNSPEDTHIFELCPDDWKLLFRYAGWEVMHERIYYQYPRRFYWLPFLWRRFWTLIDYEGFYGAILK